MVFDPSRRNWPTFLWLVRHGESAGNVALKHAEASGLVSSDIATRDVDIPLSPLGERQAQALGRWFHGQPEAAQPTVILTSPYTRAMQTAKGVARVAWADDRPVLHVVDERLREKEFGALNRLTKAGVLARYPEQAAIRDQVGKFYYRPPAGESWCDVLLRLRSVLDTIQLQYAGERVLIVAHQVVVLCFRYLLEHMTEEEVLTIDRDNDVANCSVTTYECEDDRAGRPGLVLRQYNLVAPMEEAGEAVTRRPDTPVAPR